MVSRGYHERYQRYSRTHKGHGCFTTDKGCVLRLVVLGTALLARPVYQAYPVVHGPDTCSRVEGSFCVGLVEHISTMCPEDYSPVVD